MVYLLIIELNSGKTLFSTPEILPFRLGYVKIVMSIVRDMIDNSEIIKNLTDKQIGIIKKNRL